LLAVGIRSLYWQFLIILTYGSIKGYSRIEPIFVSQYDPDLFLSGKVPFTGQTNNSANLTVALAKSSMSLSLTKAPSKVK